MLYIVYQITNQINGKIYIGAHQTENIDDGYMSSSDPIKSAIKKYGIQNFTKEILFQFNSEKEMYDKQGELVTEEFVSRSDTYNIKTGGLGGWSHWNGTNNHKESCQKGGNARKNNMPVGKHFQKNSAETKKWSEAANQKRQQMLEENPDVFAEANKKISDYQKKNNSMAGKCWCVPIDSTNYNDDKKVFPIDDIPDGWIKTTEQRNRHKKRNGTYGRYWIYNPKTRVNRLNYGNFIPNGWYKGRKMEYYT